MEPGWVLAAVTAELCLGISLGLAAHGWTHLG